MMTSTNFATLNSELSTRQAQGTLSAQVTYSLRRQLRLAGVTMRQLAAHGDITLTRIRQVAGQTRVAYITALDFQDAIEAVALRKAAVAERATIVAIIPASWRKHVRVATFASAAWCAKQKAVA